MKTIKTGVIGCGLIAQMEWLPYLHELEEYEVVAVQDISRTVSYTHLDVYKRQVYERSGN